MMPAKLRVARRHLALQPLGGRDHPVLGQRALGDRRLVERPLDVGHHRLVDAVGTDRAHRPAAGVVEQQPGALERGQPAERLAYVVVELAGDVGRPVELGDQVGENLDRLGVGRRVLAVGGSVVVGRARIKHGGAAGSDAWHSHASD